jgi:hypothetical protein
VLPEWVDSAALSRVVRIDLGLEGAWSETVCCVWDPEHGFRGVPTGFAEHHELRPALELYMPEGRIGIHCALEIDETFAIDIERLRQIAQQVEQAV